MSEVKNVPRLRFPEFADDWEWRKFTDITFLSGEKNKDNLPYKSYSVTNENGFVPQNEQFENGGTMATADKRMYYIVSKNSFAYNPARINVGSIGYYDGSENVIVSSLYEVFKTSEDINDRYLWHWFKSNNFKKLIEQYQEGGVRLYFYYDKLCMCSLPTPSIQEQIKIGRYFDNLDNLITLHQRKYDSMFEYKKAMLQKMFPKDGETVPKIRFPGFEVEWEEKKLSNCTTFRRGSFPQPYGNKEWYDGDGSMPFVQVADVSENMKLVFDTKQKISKIAQPMSVFANKGSVLVTLQGSIGRVAITQYDAFIDRTVLIFDKYNKKIDKYFWAYIIKEKFIEEAKKAPGGTIKTITKEVLSNFDLLLPSYEEQNKIGSFFKNLDEEIDLQKQKIELIKEYKKGLLQQMFI